MILCRVSAVWSALRSACWGRKSALAFDSCAMARSPQSNHSDCRSADDKRPADAGLLSCIRAWWNAYGAAFGGSRNSRRRILPTLVFGNSARNSITFGSL